MTRAAAHPLPILISAVLAAFLLLPTLTLLLRGLSADFLPTLLSPAVTDALRVSVLTSGASLGLTIIFGTPAAWLLSRRRFWGHALLESLLDLPITLPPVVAGVALLLAFGSRGVLGRPLELAGIDLAFSPAAVVLALLFTSAPFYIRTAKAGFSAYDPDTEAAARVDGAGERGVFFRVTLPLALPFLLEGLVLAWARSLGEFGATILFAGSLQGSTRTIPLAIYSAIESDLRPALVLSAIMVVFAFGLLLVLRLLSARRGT
ncbi:ABC transporter permease [Deinococcus psychrotolerans]|uniref:ABC transporter permease n=1 Tax=Deinococcus psychrotolerans TaxID=2489213 RepID=UPI001F15109A|nr:ABC transporter permease [Deinococcus psychrotolerans]